MLDSKDVMAVIIKFAIFLQLFSAYPLLNHFQRTILMNLLMPNIEKLEDIPKAKFFYLNATISIFPLLFALFYPNIGTILGLVGSISGFLMIYTIPVFTYLKMKRLEIESPLLAAAI